jgi:hypothetical protein
LIGEAPLKRILSLLVVGVLAISSLGWKAFGRPTEDTVMLGSIDLRLGMAESIALERLGEKYDVSEFGRGTYSVWWVKEKVKPSRIVGSLSFKQGKLTTAMKYWTPVDVPDTQVGFADSLFSAVRAFEREGRTGCIVSTAGQPSDSYEVKAVFISCGQKYLRIDITKEENGNSSASIAEVLEAPKTN